jgi:hypothetical protein
MLTYADVCTTRNRLGDVDYLMHTSAYVSIRQHTSAYVSIRQHTSAYVSIRGLSYAYVAVQDAVSATTRLLARRRRAC